MHARSQEKEYKGEMTPPPIEETVSTMGELIKEGKIKHWGLSNESTFGAPDTKCILSVTQHMVAFFLWLSHGCRHTGIDFKCQQKYTHAYMPASGLICTLM